NARTDVYLRGLVPAANALAEAVARGRRYHDAGADSVFVPGLVEETDVARFVADVPAPLNVLAWPGLPTAAALEQLGVRRLSAGTAIAQAAYGRMYESARAFLGVDATEEPSFSVRDLNGLMRNDWACKRGTRGLDTTAVRVACVFSCGSIGCRPHAPHPRRSLPAQPMARARTARADPRRSGTCQRGALARAGREGEGAVREDVRRVSRSGRRGLPRRPGATDRPSRFPGGGERRLSAP